MTDVAGLIADMVKEGVSAEIIGRVAAALAQREAVPVLVRDEQAERRREKDRERKRVVRGNPQTSAESADTPSLPPFPEPLSSNLSPEPPIVPQISKAEANQIADRLWSLANADGRDRSGKHLVRKAVTAALDRGATPEALELDVGRYYRQAESGDRDTKGRTFAKGLHRRIEGDHWMTADPPAAKPVTPEVQARRLTHLRDTGEWKPGWGPPPEVGQHPPFRSAA